MANGEATIADLYRVPEDGKAEIVDGELRRTSPTGDMPSRAGGAIYTSLRQFEGKSTGRAYPDNVAYAVSLPNRKSFSPDASFYFGPRTGMKFLQGAPAFAAEVRSESDYGPSAEKDLADKRADYFSAGTQVVWDVDLLSDDVVKVYRASSPDTATIYRRGERVEADPAVPGWSMPVDDLFD